MTTIRQIDVTDLIRNLDTDIATAYVKAKEAADAANEALAEAGDAFRGLCINEVVLDDGTRVVLERRDRTTYDYDKLKGLVPKSLLKRMTKRSIIASKVKEAVGLGLLDEQEVLAAATVTPVEQIRVYGN